jgi:hypothetical protein
MQMTISIPTLMPVTQLTMELRPEMILALFFGYIVMDGTVPAEIGKALDDLDEKNIPDGWKMVVSMWRNRNVELDPREICDVISPWLKEAL